VGHGYRKGQRGVEVELYSFFNLGDRQGWNMVTQIISGGVEVSSALSLTSGLDRGETWLYKYSER
jgi:hypothetical protein